MYTLSMMIIAEQLYACILLPFCLDCVTQRLLCTYDGGWQSSADRPTGTVRVVLCKGIVVHALTFPCVTRTAVEGQLPPHTTFHYVPL